MMEFAAGVAKLELSQADVARAIEFWLNERILRTPCQVTGLTPSGQNTWRPVKFEIMLAEDRPKTEEEADG